MVLIVLLWTRIQKTINHIIIKTNYSTNWKAEIKTSSSRESPCYRWIGRTRIKQMCRDTKQWRLVTTSAHATESMTPAVNSTKWIASCLVRTKAGTNTRQIGWSTPLKEALLAWQPSSTGWLFCSTKRSQILTRQSLCSQWSLPSST